MGTGRISVASPWLPRNNHRAADFQLQEVCGITLVHGNFKMIVTFIEGQNIPLAAIGIGGMKFDHPILCDSDENFTTRGKVVNVFFHNIGTEIAECVDVDNCAMNCLGKADAGIVEQTAAIVKGDSWAEL